MLFRSPGPPGGCPHPAPGSRLRGRVGRSGTSEARGGQGRRASGRARLRRVRSGAVRGGSPGRGSLRPRSARQRRERLTHPWASRRSAAEGRRLALARSLQPSFADHRPAVAREHHARVGPMRLNPARGQEWCGVRGIARGVRGVGPGSSRGLANGSRRPIPRGRARSRNPAYFFFFAAFFLVAFFFAAFFFAIPNHLLRGFVCAARSLVLAATLAATACSAAEAAQSRAARASRVASWVEQHPSCHQTQRRRTMRPKWLWTCEKNSRRHLERALRRCG